MRARGIQLSIIALLAISACEWLEVRIDSRPTIRHTAARVKEISQLDIQRVGRVRVTAAYLDGGGTASGTTRVRYSLVAPASIVEDTDIRGYLDGKVKYPYNQGTSYHMRVGRRYGGPSRARRFELKRGLVRWALPELPPEARIVSAKASFWIEAFMVDSPLAGDDPLQPLHLYAYPTDVNWVAGAGGIDKDDLSRAAPGEASWMEARVDEESWPAPGALEPNDEDPLVRYKFGPVALGTITRDDTMLTIGGPKLARYVSESSDRGSVDLLLKLDDQEEDRWGTETGILSSNFGDDKDVVSKRPRLEIEVELPYPVLTIEDDFVLEAGMAHVTSVIEHPGRTVLLAAAIEPAERIPPAAFVRGGDREVSVEDAEWEPLDSPIVRRWDWSQVMVSSPRHRVGWGENFVLEILETWVQPGPRVEQAPEMVLIAPSGRLLKIDADSVSRQRYRVEFRPDEFGLWRYGWTFRPRPNRPLGGHQGEGVFYLGQATGTAEAEMLEDLADFLVEKLRFTRGSDRAMQPNVNGFYRWVARFARQGPAEQQTADRLQEKVTEALQAARR
jgi:hypothetical protein